MKYLIPFIAALILVSCKTAEISQYQYRSTTMMGTVTTTVRMDSVIVETKGRNGESYTARATDSKEWEAVKACAANIDLKTIADLESPSNGRMSDAAPYGTFFLTVKDSIYVSGSFDGFIAPAPLMPLATFFQEIKMEQ